MLWPELPIAFAPTLEDLAQRRLEAVDEKTRWDIERMRKFDSQEDEKQLVVAGMGDFYE
jgi:hypothetical protein